MVSFGEKVQMKRREILIKFVVMFVTTTVHFISAQISQGECTKDKGLLSNSYTVSLGFLALATYFFERLIAMSMLMMAKKRRKRELYSSQIFQFSETLNEGKSTL